MDSALDSELDSALDSGFDSDSALELPDVLDDADEELLVLWEELLPELPDGVAPAYIQYIDVIHHLLETNDCVKISDISDWLNLPRPGVTRTVKEMEAKGYLKKTTSQEDARITYITVTDKGEELSKKYDADYYSRLSEYLTDITDEEADSMIATINKFYKVMSERRVDIE